jgi:uncharacterized protein (DUF1778 family)
MSSDAEPDAPVYGDSFIMQGRHAAAGQQGSHAMNTGLVRLRQRPMTAMQRQRQQTKDIIPLRLDEVEVSMVVMPANGTAATTTTLTLSSARSSSSSIVPFRRLLAATDATDEELQLSVTSVTTPSTSGSSSSSMSLAIVPRDNTMLGVVMSSAVRRRDDDVSLPMDEAVYETPFNDKNPRRTMKIKFKCKRCGATTIKPINPHAWASGSVFAKCGCCQVTHKLIDNLKLFHELAGPVFGPGTQAIQPKRERLGLRLDSDSSTLPELPPRLRLRLPLDNFPDDTAGLN